MTSPKYCLCETPIDRCGVCLNCDLNTFVEEKVDEEIRRKEGENLRYDRETAPEGLEDQPSVTDITHNRREFLGRTGSAGIVVAGGAAGGVAGVGATALSEGVGLLANVSSLESDTYGREERQKIETLILDRFTLYAEAKDWKQRLNQLKLDHPNMSADLHRLIDGTILHRTGKFQDAEDEFRKLSHFTSEAASNFNVAAYERYAKVLNNIGRGVEALPIINRALEASVELTTEQYLSLNRNKLNTLYMIHSEEDEKKSNGSWFDFCFEIEKEICKYLNIGKLAEIEKKYSGLRSGLMLFVDIANFLKYGEERHLSNHLSRIEEMVGSRQAKIHITGWNRYSQFIALCLKHQKFDSAEKGLAAAFSALIEKEVSFKSAKKQIEIIGSSDQLPVFNTTKDDVEIALHLAMWAQYGFARNSDGSDFIAREIVGQLFAHARKVLNGIDHKRFIRSIDRFLDVNGFDPIRMRNGSLGRLRSYLPRLLPDRAFFPITPTEFVSGPIPTPRQNRTTFPKEKPKI